MLKANEVIRMELSIAVIATCAPSAAGVSLAIRLSKPGDADDGKYWDTNAGGSWQASPVAWPTSTQGQAHAHSYALPAAATDGKGRCMVSVTARDSATHISGVVVYMVEAFDPTEGWATVADIGALVNEHTYTVTGAGDITVEAGSVVSGTYADTQTHDGNSLIIAESATGDPLRVKFVLTAASPDEIPVAIIFNGRYSGGAQHKIKFKAQNHETASPEIVSDSATELANSATDVSRVISLRPEHIDLVTGAITVWLDHDPATGGIAAHRLYIDKLAAVATTAAMALTAKDIALEVEAQLADEFAAITPTGDYQTTIQLVDDQDPPAYVGNARVGVYDSSNADSARRFVATSDEDDGTVGVALNAGSYKLRITPPAGYYIASPQTLTVVDSNTHPFVVTKQTATPPADPGFCNIRVHLRNSGVDLAGRSLRFETIVPQNSVNSTLGYEAIIATTDANGLATVPLAIGDLVVVSSEDGALERAQFTVPDQAEAWLADLV